MLNFVFFNIVYYYENILNNQIPVCLTLIIFV